VRLMPPALVSGGPDRNAAVAQTPAHFVELISDMAENRADHPAFRFVSATQDGELHDQLLTYRQLDQEARRIGVVLRLLLQLAPELVPRRAGIPGGHVPKRGPREDWR
jgi:hypothetical protein